MAVDMMLKVNGIDGECTKSGHENQIDVLSFRFGATQSGTAELGMGGTAGQVEIKDLTITKFIDKASPLIFFNCATGAHIPDATLHVRKAGGTALEFLTIYLTQVVISGVEGGEVGAGDRFVETVRMNFSTIKVEYTPQNADGTGGGKVTKGYNISTGQEI